MFRFLRKPPTDEAILEAMDPWTLACAAGAPNGSLGFYMHFEQWLSISRENWLPEVAKKTGASRRRIERALRGFVDRHQNEDYKTILRREEARRNLPPSLTLGPGESVAIRVEFAGPQS